MEEKHGAQEDAPEHQLPAADCQQHQPENDHGNPVPFTNPDVEFVLTKIGHVRQQTLQLVVQ